jgi:nucleotide-binding universal stress UspA family protein
MFKVIVVGADGSSTASAAVDAAVEMAKLTGASLHIVTAYRPRSARASSVPEEFRYSASVDEAESVLDSLTFNAKMAGVTVTTHPKKKGAANAILEVAEEVGADLVVMGNVGMKGARRVLGSVPNAVSHQAQCSVLIIQTS